MIHYSNRKIGKTIANSGMVKVAVQSSAYTFVVKIATLAKPETFSGQLKNKTMTNKNLIKHIRKPTKEKPLRILMSSCLTGLKCGYDGSSYGEYPSTLKLLKYDSVKIVRFCPEEFSFGTPREMCDIYGGNGLDVLNGKAKVLTESGIDWTEGMIRASEKMLEIAIKEKVEIAIMMDTSAACGSQVIYDGNRFSENKKIFFYN